MFAEAGSQRPTFLTASSNATSAEAIDLEKFSIYVIVIQGYTRRGTGLASHVQSSTGEDGKSIFFDITIVLAFLLSLELYLS